MPDLTVLKAIRHKPVVGKLGNKEGKTLQDEHRDDTCNDSVGEIERDYSEPELVSLVNAHQERLRHTRNQDNGQEARKGVSLSKCDFVNIHTSVHLSERQTM
jgi:hypothetical protein